MAENNRDYMPQRARRAIEEPAPAEYRFAAIRTRATKFALVAALVLAISGGLVSGVLTVRSAESEQLTATPAPVLAQRSVDQVSRSLDRGAQVEEPTQDATLAAADVDELVVPLAEPQPLTEFSPSPVPSRGPAQTMFATTTVNLRAEANSTSERIGSLTPGTQVSATGNTLNGFTEVKHNSKTSWASSDYLSTTAPTRTPSSSPSASKSSSPATSRSSTARSSAASSPSASSSSRQSAASSSNTGRSCTPLPGLQPRTAAVHQALCANFPQITSYGGVRSDWDVEHPSGRAIDAMTTDQATGDAVANWARSNASKYGITEVIWNQRIWTTQRASEGWRMMSDRGSATANHRDHVHITVR